MTPTDELRSALVWAEYYAHARFITQCFPTATSIERREGDLSDIEYVIRSADSDLFRFAGSDSIDYDSDLFALDLQDPGALNLSRMRRTRESQTFRSENPRLAITRALARFSLLRRQEMNWL